MLPLFSLSVLITHSPSFEILSWIEVWLSFYLFIADQQELQHDLKESLNFLRTFAKGELQHLGEQTYNKLCSKSLITEIWGVSAQSVLEAVNKVIYVMQK